MNVTGKTVRDVTQNGQGEFYGLSSEVSTTNETFRNTISICLSKYGHQPFELWYYQSTVAGIKLLRIMSFII